MANDSGKNRPRSGQDKEQSRQQSRSIDAKAAGRAATSGGVKKGGRPASSGNRPGGPKGPRGPGSGRTVTPPGRNTSAIFTWGAVGLVLVIAIIVITVGITSGGPSTGKIPASVPLSSQVTNDITQVPASVYNAVAVTSKEQLSPPVVIAGQPLLTSGGKPEVFYMGGEFCPFCGAERWAVVTSMARFGTFTGLYTMASAADDVDPSTPTMTFAHATYTSPYITFVPKEYYSNVRTSTNQSYTILQHLSKSEQALVTKYNTSTYLGGTKTKSGSIPFIDFGNKVLVSGASYSPTILQGLTRTTIAGGLKNSKSAVTQAIIATSNFLSASTCSVDGGKPASVCTSPGVMAGAKTLGLTS